MIPVLSSPGATGAYTMTSAARSSLGKNEFLTLLVTQLRNQDPLSPLQPHEFAAQLAQFTSVEQLTQLQEAVGRQADALDLNSLIAQTGFAASLIGRQVVAAGNGVVVPESGSAKVRVEVGGGGGRGTLVVRNSSGQEVASRDLGTLAPGRHSFLLPPNLPAGNYTYEVKVVGAGDVAMPVTTYTTGVVEGVSFKNGQIVLRIGGMDVPLDTVAEIESAPASSGGSSGGEEPLPPPAPEPLVGARRRP